LTCVIGAIDKGTVTIGADSAGSDGYQLAIRADPKVALIGTQFVMGFCGSFRAWQIIRFNFAPPEYRRGPLDKYMSTTFVEALRRCLLDGGVTEKKDNVEELPANFLVGVRGRLFQIENDMQVGESVHPYDAIGCGAQVALGAMHARKEGSVRARILAALKASSTFSEGVRPPYRLETR
jgi:ATP-dependent protease HslVU (ClpYQ) peptidase subunit